MSASGPSTGPDELERFFRRLVLNIAQLDSSRLDAPLPVVDVHQNFVPYRTHRALLAFETHQDYEMTILRLLAGEGGFARVEPDEVRQLLEHEVQAVSPDTGIFRRFPSATVRLEPDQVREVLGAPPPPDAGPPVPGPEPAPPAVTAFEFAEGETAADDEDAGQPDLPFSLADGEHPEEIEPVGREVSIGGAQCGYCGGDLPVGRTVIFCPHCGQNVGVMHCSVCGTELDVGWQFCITCGREMGGLT